MTNMPKEIEKEPHESLFEQELTPFVLVTGKKKADIQYQDILQNAN